MRADEIGGTDLTNRLVAAYPIGFHIDGTNGLPICQTPTETGCQNSWNTVGPRAERLFTLPSSICVNPLTWLLDEVYADHNANLGAVNFESELGVGIEEGADRFDTIQPGVADAQCRDGRLHVSQIRSSQYSLMQLGRDNYHIYDYALFYINIRQNAQARVDAFCGANVLDCLLALRAPDWGNWTHIE